MSDRTFAVSSNLTGDALATCRALWDRLEERFGVRKMRAAVDPHVTFVVGTHDDPDALDCVLAKVAAEIRPFDVELDGAGSFPTAAPVVFLRVVKTPDLLRTYERVHAAMTAAGLEPWPHYTPDIWVPHVTLALQDTTQAGLAEILAEVEAGPTRFSTRLEAFDLLHVVDPLHAYLGTYPFGHCG